MPVGWMDACLRAYVRTPGTTTTQVSATSFQSSQLQTYVKASNPWLCHQKKHTIGGRYCCCRYGHHGRGCSGHVCTFLVRKTLLRPLFCFTSYLQRRAESRLCFVGLAYQGKDSVFRFSIRDFGPWCNNRSIFIWGFLKDDILACVETWD